MTDEEINKACAVAMEWSPDDEYYKPLIYDAQAMALVKRFRLMILPQNGWQVEREQWRDKDGTMNMAANCSPDLNRAICECVAGVWVK